MQLHIRRDTEGQMTPRCLECVLQASSSFQCLHSSCWALRDQGWHALDRARGGGGGSLEGTFRQFLRAEPTPVLCDPPSPCSLSSLCANTRTLARAAGTLPVQPPAGPGQQQGAVRAPRTPSSIPSPVLQVPPVPTASVSPVGAAARVLRSVASPCWEQCPRTALGRECVDEHRQQPLCPHLCPGQGHQDRS